MDEEVTREGAAASGSGPDAALADGTHLSRRQAIGRMSAFATAGAAAWIVPEILTAKPAAGATLSGPAVVTAAATTSPTTDASAAPATSPQTTSSPATALAYTGLNIQRDAEIGAALVAGGWALHHWASRTSPAPAKDPGAPG